MNREVPLGDAVHNALCHHVNECATGATTHILLPFNDENVLACDEHAALFGVGAEWDKVDDHPVGAVCGWAGVMWSFRDKCCYVADDDFKELTTSAEAESLCVAAASVPAPAAAASTLNDKEN